MAWGRLALIHAAGESADVIKGLSAVLGYRARSDVKSVVDVNHSQSLSMTEFPDLEGIVQQSGRVDRCLPPARFLRVRRMTRKQPENEAKADYLSDPAWQFSTEDRRQGGTYQFAKPEPLLPMSRLLPFLLNSLGQQRPGARLDHRLLARQVAKGQAVRKLPFVLRQRWSQRLLVLVDASQRLESYWADFEFIVTKLQQQLGTEVVIALRFDEAYRGRELRAVSWPDSEGQWQAWQAPAANVPVLILGDLGVDDQSGDSRAFWLQIAGRLHAHDAPVLTLNPLGYSAQAQRLNRRLQPNPLHDQQRLPRYPLRNGFDVRGQVDWNRVLACLSVLPMVDTGLLRRLRQRLGWGGGELEGQLWNHPDIQQTALGIRVRNYSEKYQRIYQQQVAGTETAKTLWEVVTEHHQDAYPGLRQLEQASRCVTEQQDSADVRAYLQRLAASVVQDNGGLQQRAALLQQAKTVLSVLPEQVWASDFSDLAYDVFALVHDKAIRAGDWPEVLPAGFEPAKAVRRVLEHREPLETERWHIVQVGSEGEFTLQKQASMGDLQVTPVAEMDSLQGLSPVLSFPPGEDGQRLLVKEGVKYSNQSGLFRVESMFDWLEVDWIEKPGWAHKIWRDQSGLKAEIVFAGEAHLFHWSPGERDGEWEPDTQRDSVGFDDYGLYADLDFSGITQRFRWIESGKFTIDSFEGAIKLTNIAYSLYQVTLSKGFWLADTNVSEDLWALIQGESASLSSLSTLTNTVKRANLEQCNGFLINLHKKYPGLDIHFISKGDWKYIRRIKLSNDSEVGKMLPSSHILSSNVASDKRSVPKVFISYSHDSDSHKDSVLSLANRLRSDGIECQLDQYVSGVPDRGWQHWMESQINDADYVLVVCTPKYLKCFQGLSSDGGTGVHFEGVLITEELYDLNYEDKFLPVLFEGGEIDDIPAVMRGLNTFQLMKDYNGLYQILTNQTIKIISGELVPRLVIGSINTAVNAFNRSPEEGIGGVERMRRDKVFKNIHDLLSSAPKDLDPRGFDGAEADYDALMDILEHDEDPWEADARNAVEAILDIAEIDEKEQMVHFYQKKVWNTVVSNYEELIIFLAEVASDSYSANCPNHTLAENWSGNWLAESVVENHPTQLRHFFDG